MAGRVRRAGAGRKLGGKEAKSKSIMIKVTAGDIAIGHRSSALLCPVALALKRAFPRRWCTVSTREYGVGDKVEFLSKEVQQFIESFDAGYPVKPFQFRISL